MPKSPEESGQIRVNPGSERERVLSEKSQTLSKFERVNESIKILEELPIIKVSKSTELDIDMVHPDYQLYLNFMLLHASLLAKLKDIDRRLALSLDGDD